MTGGRLHGEDGLLTGARVRVLSWELAWRSRLKVPRPSGGEAPSWECTSSWIYGGVGLQEKADLTGGEIHYS